MNVDFNFTKELMYDVEKHLYDNPDTRRLVDELNMPNDKTFGIFIENGDWKHEHLWLDHLVSDYLNSRGIEFDSFTKHVGTSDSDCYTAWHYFHILGEAEPMFYDVEGDDELAASKAQEVANTLKYPVSCRGVIYKPALTESGYKSGDKYYGGLPAEPDYKGPEKSARYYKELIEYFKDIVKEYFEYDVIGTSPVCVVLKTPDGKERVDLTKFDVCSDAEEAVEMASHYFDESLFEAKKKKKNGALVNPDAGNVEHNIEMFNKMNSPVEGPCNNPVSGPFGGGVMSESVDESYNVQFYQIFRSPTRPNENGKMVAQAGSEEEAHTKGKELCGAGNYLIKAVCNDGKVRYLECVTDSMNEAHVSRDQMISELKCNGKRYNFSRFTDAQIYKMYQKYVANKPQIEDDHTDEYEFVVHAMCDRCGIRLNDGGTCPICDDGEEDYFDEDLDSSDYDSEIELYYPKLEFTAYGPQRDVDDWDERDVETDWSYYVDQVEVEEFLCDICQDDLPEDDYDAWNTYLNKFVHDNFDELFEKYKQKILDHWEDYATEDAQENYDFNEDGIDWDSMPGGHDDFDI